MLWILLFMMPTCGQTLKLSWPVFMVHPRVGKTSLVIVLPSSKRQLLMQHLDMCRRHQTLLTWSHVVLIRRHCLPYTLWWHGPDWLSQNLCSWPSMGFKPATGDLENRKHLCQSQHQGKILLKDFPNSLNSSEFLLTVEDLFTTADNNKSTGKQLHWPHRTWIRLGRAA